MGVYHITYAPELKEICLYFDGRCNFSCHGCITNWHPEDCHIEEPRQTRNRTLNIEEVTSYLKPLSFKRTIFLGKEPTQDRDFLPLARILKERFSTYNILLTNGYEFMKDKAIDEVCVSIKAIRPSLFKDFTGKDNPQKVLENFKRYYSIYSIRAETVLIPEYIDKEEIEKIACFIASIDKNIPYRIDGYIPTNACFNGKDKFRRPNKEEMEQAKTRAERYLKSVSILHSKVKVKYKVERIY
jgi:pyruvate-formate lyase-activating enzyme